MDRLLIEMARAEWKSLQHQRNRLFDEGKKYSDKEVMYFSTCLYKCAMNNEGAFPIAWIREFIHEIDRLITHEIITMIASGSEKEKYLATLKGQSMSLKETYPRWEKQSNRSK